MQGNHQNLQSIRSEQQPYEEQIRRTYQQHPHLFVTHSSDLLHLDITERSIRGHTYRCLVARSGYSKYDLISEVRGSIISYQKLRKIVEQGTVDRNKLPTLLYLNYQLQHLISPKNITKYLFTSPAYSGGNGGNGKGNCYVENHFGSKLLVIASRDIEAGEELELEPSSYSRTIYRYSPSQF